MKNVAIAMTLLVCVMAAGGCETSAQTGALGGAGIGALAGQAIGGNTSATLIGAGVGAGVGYIVGNEKDKAEAKKMQQSQRAMPRDRGENTAPHRQVGPLGGTSWEVISVNPRDAVQEFSSKIVEFRQHGRVITTTTLMDGSVKIDDERYRVVGQTLIVNDNDYLINARFRIDGNQLIVDAEKFSAVLRRL